MNVLQSSFVLLVLASLGLFGMDSRGEESAVTEEGHDWTVAAMAIDAAGERVVTVGPGGRAILWEVKSGKPVANRDLKQKDEAVTCAVFHPDGETILLGTGSPNGRSADVLSWRPADGRLKRLARLRRTGIDQLVISPDGKRLLVIAGPNIRGLNVAFLGETSHPLAALISLPSGKRLRTKKIVELQPWYGFRGDRLLEGAPRGKQLVLNDFVDGRTVERIELHGVEADQNETGTFCVAPDFEHAVRMSFRPWPDSIPEDERPWPGKFGFSLRHDVWNLQTGKPFEWWVARPLMPANVRFTSDGRLLAIDVTGEIVVREVRGWRTLWTLDPADTPRRTPNPDAALDELAVRGLERELGLGEGQVEMKPRPRAVKSFEFSGDGRRMAVLTADPAIFAATGFLMTIRDARTGRIVSRWTVPTRRE